MTQKNQPIENKNTCTQTKLHTQIWKNLWEHPLSSLLYFSFFTLMIFSSKSNVTANIFLMIFKISSASILLSIAIIGGILFSILKYKKNFFDKNFLYVFLFLHISLLFLFLYNTHNIKIRELNLFFIPIFIVFMYLLALLQWHSKQFVIKVSNYIFLMYILFCIFNRHSFDIVLFIFAISYHVIFMILFLMFSTPNNNPDKSNNFPSIYLFVCGGISYFIVFCILPLFLAI